MKLTKTWLSYIVWGLFSIIFFTNIGIAAIEIHIKNEMTDFLMPMLIMYGGTILGILLLIGLYKLYEKYILPKADEESPVLQGAFEWVVLALVFLVAVAVRAIAIISATGQLEGTTEYFDYAISHGSAGGFSIHNNGSYLYSGILGFILGFLGHFPAAAMSVQAGIQLITILVTYFMLKKALGRLPAWIAVALLSFLPGSFLAVRTCTPDALFTMFLSLYLLALVYLCDANREQKIKIGAHGLFYILMGVFAAFLAYIDIAGLLAFVVGVVAIVQSKSEDAWLKIQKPFLQVLLYSVAFVFGLVLLLWFLPTGNMEVGPESVMAYVSSFIPNGGLNLMIMSPHKGQWDCIALFIFAGLWFVGFLRNKQDKAFPYAIMIVFLTIASFLGMGTCDYTLFASYLWIMLATIGISTIHNFRKTERDVAVAEKTKENTAKRKAERERRRSEAAGEKSIQLDDIVKKKTVDEPVFENKETRTFAPAQSSANAVKTTTNYDSTSKKSYGIGRKADTPVVEEENKKAEISSHPTVHSGSAKMETGVGSEEAVQNISGQATNKTVVKKVDRPPLATPPAPIPVESKPAYSQGSRSRRSLRSPSKSTFTPEDLERISRYTGVSYLAAQTVQPKEEPVVDTLVDDTLGLHENASVNTDTEELNSSTDTNGYIELDEEGGTKEENAEGLAAEQKEENAEGQTAEQKEEAAEGQETEQKEENAEDQATEQNEEAAEPITPLAPYVSPSRRHFRHPSKSTFSPEELEKISQYTGIDYKQSMAKTETEKQTVSTSAVSSDVLKSDNTQAVTQPKAEAVQVKESLPKEKPVAASKPAEETKGKHVASSRPAGLDLDSIDVKSNPDRKPKLIRNPLPGPKPHVARELSYDYTPKESEMDFDIIDLKGKDYFDL